MNTISAFTGWNTENSLWYQQFYLKQITILKGGPSTVDFDAADKKHLYVTTTEAKDFQVDIPQLQLTFSTTTLY